MNVLEAIYQLILIQPIYNLLVWAYATFGQEQLGLTLIIIAVVFTAGFMPMMIRNYMDQEKTKDLQDKVATIQAEVPNPIKQQQQITAMLKQEGVQFKSESIFLFGLGALVFLLYPILQKYWHIDQELLYSFIVAPEALSSNFGTLDLTAADATLSLLPAILLFFELRQSYKQQSFLTGFVDRWYAVILPLFVYFLIFWLPSGISLVLIVCLLMSLYVRTLLNFFTNYRRKAG